MTRTLRESAAGLRLAAASLALFAVLGAAHILPALHFALVVHCVCAEHGELLHEAAPASRPEVPTETSVSAGGSGSHEHEHCPVVGASGSFAVLAPPAERSAPACPGSEAEAFGRARVAHPCIALLAYAPKLAPPPARS